MPADHANQDSLVIHWFRRDLRLRDNTALISALNSGIPVMPLFILDENILKRLDPDDRRMTFIFGALDELDRQLSQLGSGLKLLYGSPEQLFSRLTAEYPVRAVYTNADYEPYALQRDDRIEKLLALQGIRLHTFKDQVIFEKGEILKDNGEPYSVFTPYSRKWMARLMQDTSCLKEQPFPSNPQFMRTTGSPGIKLSDIGFKESFSVWSAPLLNEDLIRKYETTRDFPALDATSHMSIHLRFGTVSIRELVRKGLRLNQTWLNELIWREFFMQVLYHYPFVVERPFKQQYEKIVWRNNEPEFEKWCNGLTGYPLVDAGMRQLRETGYMHNRVRMVTASFLCKHLLIDWRWGEAWFARYLLDFELSSNNGNWQWAAGTGCDAAPYFRIFNPENQLKTYDAGQEYVRKWLPEYGKPGYPKPVVDHVAARNRCLQAYSVVK